MTLFRKKKDDLTLELEALKKKNAAYNTQANPVYAETGEASLTIEDVFTITGRGTVVTGTVKIGTFHTGDNIIIVHQDGTTIQSTIAGIEAFRKILEAAVEGDAVGVLLRGVGKDDVKSGDIIRKC